MPIRFVCTNCKKSLTAPDDRAGSETTFTAARTPGVGCRATNAEPLPPTPDSRPSL